MENKDNLPLINTELLTDSLSKVVVLPGESLKEAYKIRVSIEKDVSPVGALEEILCSKIIADVLRLRRLYILEAKILREQQGSVRDNDSYTVFTGALSGKKKRFRSTIKQVRYTKQLEEIQRHLSVIHSGIVDTITQTKSLQKLRAGKQ